MIIDETIWLILILWLGLIAFSKRNIMLGASAGMVGVFFGLILIQVVYLWFGLIVVALSIYLMYDAVLGDDKK